LRPYYLKWIYFRLHPEARPKHWQDSWGYPNVSLEQAAAFVEPASGLDFMFLPMTDWHARLQRPHHLARALAAAGHRCFYLNPNVGREYPQPSLFSSPRIAKLQERVYEVHVPLFREPVFHHRLLHSRESDALARSINQVALGLGVKSLVQIVSFPVWMEAAQTVRRSVESVIVYDCHDLLGGFSRIAKELVDAELECLRNSDLVLFSAQALADTMVAAVPEVAARSTILRNGVDTAHFAAARRPRGPQHRTAKPVIGYVGALDEWFDVETVRAAAQAHPDWRFVFLGRVEDPRIQTLASLSNIELRGEVPYADLAVHLKEFDVGLIPFLRTPLTLATNPIKLYEYFGCGLAAVSTALPEVEKFAGLVYLADTPAVFVRQLEAAILEQDPSLPEQRLAVAAQESWQARMKQLVELVQPSQSKPAVGRRA
jgi:glycosyltransferase involved in cell wall biosynthesis